MTKTIKYNLISSARPNTTKLAIGEIAQNATDGKLFMRKYIDGTDANDEIVEIIGNVVNTPDTKINSVAASGGAVGSDRISDIISLTQAEYDAIGSPVSTMLYIVVG